MALKIFAIYLLIMNIYGFFLMGKDKRLAGKGKWRVKEKTLFISAALGGALGSFLGMKVFHHKTLHTKFVIGIPFLMFVWILIAAAAYCYLPHA